jgi:signal transduction histidine kinase
MVTGDTLGPFFRRLAFLAGIWTVPVVLGVAGHYFGEMASADRMPAIHYIGHSLALWYVWIPATPVIVWIHKRQFRPLPMIGAHALVLAIVFLGQDWLSVVIGRATGHLPATLTPVQNLRGAAENLLVYDMIIYAAVLAVAVGIDYGRRYRDRDLRASQLETQLARARLASLQTQLQPHFLFNALNAIAMLVRRDRKREAVDTIVGFSELLRYVLDESGTIDVPLEEELRFVQRYLDIEGVRLGDRLTVETIVDPGAMGAIVPNLLLQPVVENALKHSSSVRPRGGQLTIRAHRYGSALRLEVEDDGPGLAPDFDVERSSGIGLRNLRERLSAFFGDSASLAIVRPANGVGTRVIIELPFRQASDVAEREPALATR